MQKNKKISEELKTEMHELHRDFHDLYPLHTPSNEEDRETGFGSVATEEEKADPVKATTEKKKLTPVFLLSLLIVAGLTAACLAWPLSSLRPPPSSATPFQPILDGPICFLSHSS